MSPTPHRPAELLRGPFLAADAVRQGLVTRSQLRGKSWTRLLHDVYVPAELGGSYRARCEAFGLILPPDIALSGRSAACLDGLPVSDDFVHLIAPPGTRFRRPGCRLVRTSWLPRGHDVPGRPSVTNRTRSAWEVACEDDVVEAVVALDIMFRAGRPRQAAMDAWIAAYPDSTPAYVLSLADSRAESPQETRARVRLVLAGVPRPVPQNAVIGANGRFVARVDLAWPAARVVVEYDGIWHANAQQLISDRARLNRLQNAGWQVLHLTVADLNDPERFAAFVAQLQAALQT